MVIWWAVRDSNLRPLFSALTVHAGRNSVNTSIIIDFWPKILYYFFDFSMRGKAVNEDVLQLLNALIREKSSREKRSTDLLKDPLRIADGWYMCVPPCFNGALDIKQTIRIKNKSQALTWTQGAWFSFGVGDSLYDTADGYKPWFKCLESSSVYASQVKAREQCRPHGGRISQNTLDLSHLRFLRPNSARTRLLETRSVCRFRQDEFVRFPDRWTVRCLQERIDRPVTYNNGGRKCQKTTRPEIAGTHSITAVALGLFSVLLALVLLLVPFIFDEYKSPAEPHELIGSPCNVTGGWCDCISCSGSAPRYFTTCARFGTCSPAQGDRARRGGERTPANENHRGSRGRAKKERSSRGKRPGQYYRIALTVTGAESRLLVTLAHGTTMTLRRKDIVLRFPSRVLPSP